MFKNIASKITVAAALVAGISSMACAQDQPPAAAGGGIGVQTTTISDTPKTAGSANKGVTAGSATKAATPGSASKVDATDEASMTQKASLVLGYNAIGKMAFDLKRQGVELDMEQVLAGARMAADGKDLGMEKEEVSALFKSLQGVIKKKQAKLVAEAAAKNKSDGEAFLAENEKKEGVKKLENGVQYEVLTQGEGPKPTAKDKVVLHYHGTTTDGKVFDSSVDRKKPITRSASAFVKGFNAAVQAMPVGSKWRVTIPSDLAYGMSGPLGPNRTLNFEIELLEIVGEKAPVEPAAVEPASK